MSDTAQFTLPHLQTREALAEAAAALQALRGQNLELDFSSVEKLSTRTMQLTMSCLKSWMQDGKAFSVINVSENTESCIRLLGIDDMTLPIVRAA